VRKVNVSLSFSLETFDSIELQRSCCLQDVSDPEVPDIDPCQSYVCEDGELSHFNNTEMCDCPLVSVKIVLENQQHPLQYLELHNR
jgi:hypothetical protein